MVPHREEVALVRVEAQRVGRLALRAAPVHILQTLSEGEHVARRLLRQQQVVNVNGADVAHRHEHRGSVRGPKHILQVLVVAGLENSDGPVVQHIVHSHSAVDTARHEQSLQERTAVHSSHRSVVPLVVRSERRREQQLDIRFSVEDCLGLDFAIPSVLCVALHLLHDLHNNFIL